MQQEDYWGDEKKEYFSMGFTIFKNQGSLVDENTKITQNMVYLWSGPYQEQRDLMVEFKEVEANLAAYTIVASTYEPGEHTRFTITVFSMKPVEFAMIQDAI